MNALVAEWLAKAKGDLNTAQRELRARRAPNYDAVCYHSQQCAEKMLKEFIVSNDATPPRTHNLIELLRLCLAPDSTFDMVRPALEELNGYSVVIRYPGVTAAKQDASDAFKLARQVHDFVAAKL